MYRFSGFQYFSLLYISNNNIYWGWPWGKERIKEPFTLIEDTEMIFEIVDSLKDMPSVVLAYGSEHAFLPKNYPFPVLAFAPSLTTSHIPWPFYEGWRDEKLLLLEAYEKKIDFSNEKDWEQLMNQKPWPLKIQKAAFFARFDENRHLMFEVARVHPSLFDLSTSFFPQEIQPIDPTLENAATTADYNASFNSFPFGAAAGVNAIPRSIAYNPSDYKYVIVPMGMQAMSTSGRIFSLLARSRSVVLLQGGPFTYHFSARMQPWVHYVPLSASGAEIAEVVSWLREHDDMAKQIAENGYNLGRSYLRLEDYYCYGASVLYELGELEKNSTVLEPFQMQLAHLDRNVPYKNEV